MNEKDRLYWVGRFERNGIDPHTVSIDNFHVVGNVVTFNEYVLDSKRAKILHPSGLLTKRRTVYLDVP